MKKLIFYRIFSLLLVGFYLQISNEFHVSCIFMSNDILWDFILRVQLSKEAWNALGWMDGWMSGWVSGWIDG